MAVSTSSASAVPSMKMAEDKLRGGNRRAEGASTITQQVAKNFLLSSDRTLERKLKEAILAIRIERAYPKDKILELYLNEIYLGIGSYGVAAAALNYFNKELKDLTHRGGRLSCRPAEGAQQLPSVPPTKEATIRRDWIIDQMADNGLVTAEQAKAAKAKPLTVNFRPFGTQIYAADYFAEDVRRTLVAQFGEDGLYGRSDRSSAGDGRVNGGLSVRTTFDPDSAAHGAQGADRRPRGLRPRQGMARRRSAHRDRRGLGGGAERHRDSDRHPALAAGRRAGGAEGQGRGRPAARAAGGRLASWPIATRWRYPSTR